MGSIAYAAIEGINFDRNFYVIRELSVVFPNGDLLHLHFKNPENMRLTQGQLKTAWFTKNFLNGFGVDDSVNCCIPNENCADILKSIANYEIRCAGDITKRCLARYLPTTQIIDVSEWGFTYPRVYFNPNCSIKHGKQFRYCTLFKVHCLQLYGLNM